LPRICFSNDILLVMETKNTHTQNQETKNKMDKKISLFGEFQNQKHLNEYVDSISTDKQNKAEIWLLLGMFEQTCINGFKETQNKGNKK